MANSQNPVGLSKSDYAKRRGVSPAMVTKYDRCGKLVFTEDGKIDVKKTDRILDAESGGSAVKKLKEKGGKKGAVKSPVKRSVKTLVKSEPAEKAEEDEIPDLPEEVKAVLGDRLLTKHQAETLKENYLAKLRKLEYEKKSGKVVEVEPLKKILFEMWRQERDALLNLPSRIGATIAAELGIDQNRLIILLEQHIHEFLNERADQPRIRLA